VRIASGVPGVIGLIGALALAGCQSSAPATGSFADAGALHASVSKAMEDCWFSGDPAFAAYVYTPEINAGTPRILVVPRNEPTGLPLLVVEAKGGSAVEFYGPLLVSETGPRIRADLGRWSQGGTSCA
jgi:hypothetical protein